MRKSVYNKCRIEYLAKDYTNHKVSNNSKITIFHVGGRGALGATGCFKSLGPYANFVVFEADIDDSEDSKKFSKYLNSLKEAGCTIEFENKCVAGSCGTREFHINEFPSSSSLLKINPKAGKYWHRYSGIWKDHCKEQRSIEVETITFDSLRHSEKKYCEPNFLTLDVQGAEYEILSGSSSYLDTDILGMVVEAEFFPVYKDQPLFNEIFSLLAKRGFLFFDFTHLQSWYVGRHNWKKGQLIVTESLFLKNYEDLIEKITDKSNLVLQLLKLARIALCHEYDSYAFEIMELLSQEYSQNIEQLDPLYKDQLAFCKFIKENDND